MKRIAREAHALVAAPSPGRTASGCAASRSVADLAVFANDAAPAAVIAIRQEVNALCRTSSLSLLASADAADAMFIAGTLSLAGPAMISVPNEVRARAAAIDEFRLAGEHALPGPVTDLSRSAGVVARASMQPVRHNVHALPLTISPPDLAGQRALARPITDLPRRADAVARAAMVSGLD